MLIHECMDCDSLSINRIAADDDSDSILLVFQSSLAIDHRERCIQEGIVVLDVRQSKIVYEQLYGQNAVGLIPS